MRSVLQNEMKNYVMPSIQIDSHQAKLGKDEDVSVLKIECKDKVVAEDLVKFIETGYKYVLDADMSPAKDVSGVYNVFVEMQRNENLPENIMNMIRDVENITGMLPWRFKFHKSDAEHKLTQENVQTQIPMSASEYKFLTDENVDEDIKKFFESSTVKRVYRSGKRLTLHKKYVHHNFMIEGVNAPSVSGVYRIDENSTSQSSYISGWLGGSYQVVKVGDIFKLSKNDTNVLLKAKEIEL